MDGTSTSKETFTTESSRTRLTPKNLKRYIVYRDDRFYGAGPLDFIDTLIHDFLDEHMNDNYEVTFRIVEKRF